VAFGSGVRSAIGVPVDVGGAVGVAVAVGLFEGVGVGVGGVPPHPKDIVKLKLRPSKLILAAFDLFSNIE